MKPIRKLSERKTTGYPFGRTKAALFFISILTFVQSANADTFICESGDADCVINAIIEANANGEEDLIRLKPGTYELTGAVGTSTNGFPVGLPPITSAITIKGASATKTVIKRSRDAEPLSIFWLENYSEAALKLKRLTLSGAKVSKGGGGGNAVSVGNGTRLVLADTVIRDNNAGCGAIGAGSEATLVVRRSHIVHNKAITGAGFCADPADVTITKSTISFNEAEFSGGGIYCDTCNLAIRDSAFIGNTELGNDGGGGIFAFAFESNAISIFNSVFYGNRTAERGGAIAVLGIPVSIRQSLFVQNHADELGGAIFFIGSETKALEVSSSLIFQNKAGVDGGGIFKEGSGTVDVVRSLIIGNTPNNCTGCP